MMALKIDGAHPLCHSLHPIHLNAQRSAALLMSKRHALPVQKHTGGSLGRKNQELAAATNAQGGHSSSTANHTRTLYNRQSGVGRQCMCEGWLYG